MAAGGYSGTTLNDLIERTYSRLLNNQREQIVLPSVNVLVGDTAITFTGPAASGIHLGSIIALEEEKILVSTPTPNNNNNNWNVIRGFQDSTPAAHTTSAIGIVDPKYDRFMVGQAINDALNYLSSPTYGLFRVLNTTFTYNPVQQGYDLGSLPNNFLEVLELTYDLPDASHNFPKIRYGEFEILRGVTNAKFASGQGIILYRPAVPGLVVNLTVSAPFVNLVNLTDDVVTLGGLPATAIDIPSLCAEIDLTATREIKRDFIEGQPDARRAADVPAGAMSAAVTALMIHRDRRIAVEADRLRRLYPRL
jgi:hypothetical protein